MTIEYIDSTPAAVAIDDLADHTWLEIFQHLQAALYPVVAYRPDVDLAAEAAAQSLAHIDTVVRMLGASAQLRPMASDALRGRLERLR